MPLDLDSRPRPSEHAVFRGMRDGGVVLHLETGQYHGLNSTGALIWQLLDGQRTVAEISRALDEQVTDAPPDLESLVLEFAAGLEQRGLVVAQG